MKRMHLHVSVPNLAQSITFYETLFGSKPAVVKDDYAKWMLSDPMVNFAISERTRALGVDHIGIQVEDAKDLEEMASRLKAADIETLEQEATICCYAKSDKSWVHDPAGVRWETFVTFGEATTYGEDEVVSPPASETACCRPASISAPEKACC